MTRFWIEFLNKFSGAPYAEEDVKPGVAVIDSKRIEWLRKSIRNQLPQGRLSLELLLHRRRQNQYVPHER